MTPAMRISGGATCNSIGQPPGMCMRVRPFQSHSNVGSKQRQTVLHFQRYSERSNAGKVEAATLERAEVSEDSSQESQDVFSWTKQWYPIASVADLDPSRPHPAMLLGKKLVLWRDPEQQWRCFEDSCPHRNVPLSEGRLEESHGYLQCGYHGWTFSGDGKTTRIPQLASTDKKAEESACSNTRSCATVRPTQVRQGLLWVWGEASANASLEAAVASPAVSEYRDSVPDEKWVDGFSNYVRDLPGSFEMWIENMCDQSHVSFAHHGVVGSRGGEHEGFFEMHELNADPKAPAQEGFSCNFSWSGNGKSINKGVILDYKPPCLCSFKVSDKPFNLWIYAVPISASCTRIIINSGGELPVKPLFKALKSFPFTANLLRVLPHWNLNSVNDGDIVFMHQQSANVGRGPTDHVAKWNHNYFLPGENDRAVIAFLNWLKNKADQGPKYAAEVLPETNRDSLGNIKREELLDRYTQHTKHCKSCSKALAQAQAVQKAAIAALGILFLTASALLGRGLLPWSPPVLAVAAVAAACGFLLAKLRSVEAKFIYTGWHQADLSPVTTEFS